MSNLLCKQTIPKAKATAELFWLNKPGITGFLLLQSPGKEWDKFPVPVSGSNGSENTPWLNLPLAPIPPVNSLLKLVFSRWNTFSFTISAYRINHPLSPPFPPPPPNAWQTLSNPFPQMPTLQLAPLSLPLPLPFWNWAPYVFLKKKLGVR